MQSEQAATAEHLRSTTKALEMAHTSDEKLRKDLQKARDAYRILEKKAQADLAKQEAASRNQEANLLGMFAQEQAASRTREKNLRGDLVKGQAASRKWEAKLREAVQGKRGAHGVRGEKSKERLAKLYARVDEVQHVLSSIQQTMEQQESPLALMKSKHEDCLTQNIWQRSFIATSSDEAEPRWLKFQDIQ